jgi:hypothetical protein
MAIPTLTRLSQDRGPTSGGDIVRLSGTNLSTRLAVWFGGAEAEVLRVVGFAGGTFADVRTPAHAPALVDVVAWNLDQEGLPLEAERAALTLAYRFLRTPLTSEATLTRLVRALLQALKRDVLENTLITVSVDYQEPIEDDEGAVVVSRFPSLVLSGPVVSENRRYGAVQPKEELVLSAEGPEVRKRRPPFTADLSFTITGASASTQELLNLMSSVATFIHRTRWLSVARDPADLTADNVRWELHADGAMRTNLSSRDGARVFTAGVVVRGVDLEEGLPLELTRKVERSEVGVRPFTAESAA